ncbi:MAG: DNA phosphorothioation-associated putative methyltransferase, partial [Candidatus Binatia bacterium]
VREQVQQAARHAGLETAAEFNVIKIDDEGQRISLLYYENFFEDPFPALQRSCVVDLISGQTKPLRYDLSANPPILHRKELLLPHDHPQVPLFAALTAQLEAAGLFRNARQIGFARQWHDRLQSAGYAVRDHQLVTVNGTAPLARHRTALQRYSLSTPMQALQRHGYLDGTRTIFDYGCGKGDDVRILRHNGIDASGWDPHFSPNAPHTPAHIVNLGFVVNVIEDPTERAQALRSAYALAGHLLSVAVMLARGEHASVEQYGDGVRTRHNTFQKYYTQREFRAYLQSVLDKEPVAAGPGIFFVFKDENEEQRFFAQRVRNRGGLDRLISRLPKPTRAEREQTFYDTHRELLDSLWETWLDLGRKPDPSEVAHRTELERVCGSLGKALQFLEQFHGTEATTAAFTSRKEDLLVYFALQQFEQRKRYTALSDELRRDIKTFFGTYQQAQTEARQLLFSAGNRDLVRQLCRDAASTGLGWLEKDQALYLHTSLVERLPAVLRVYVGCASYLYGDVTSADILKIHIDSAKLTLLSCDDFVGKPLPRLLERIQIRFRVQDVERFTYGDASAPPYVYRKSRFLTEDFPYYAEQVAFEQALDVRQLFDVTNGVGPAPQVFDDRLRAARLEIDGFTLRPTRTVPDLDDCCGRYLTFRELIHCGETQATTGITNLPLQLATYTALTQLATLVLDPVIDYFGDIVLTYGFCSRELAKQISGRIAPHLDQHTSHEVNTKGNPVCPRLGAAADFLVTDENMLEVAQWIVHHTPFDRLYFYGDDRPIHVSYGPEQKREIVMMIAKVGKPFVPKVMKVDAFLTSRRPV